MTAKELKQQADAVVAEAKDALLGGARLHIVKAPPGAGKTHLLVELLAAGVAAKMRLAVGTFTNNQANDVCERLVDAYPHVRVVRWVSASAIKPVLGGVSVVDSVHDIPSGPCVVVSSTAKWGLSNSPEFDALLVDEAWQISWADFVLMRGVAGRFFLIGDPGQIPPVVSIETDRWETSPNAPHIPTPELLTANRPADVSSGELPGSWRLPHDSAGLVNEFYDFRFGAFAAPGERFVRVANPTGPAAIRKAVGLLNSQSMVTLTLPTPIDGPPLEIDDDIAGVVSKTVRCLLDGSTTLSHSAITAKRPLAIQPDDIGIVSTHRVMNTRLFYELPKKLQHQIRVDTPERWQGLQKKVMIAVHPLSGVTDPATFDLETGRLCVMASRHQCGLIMVTRDHVPDTLRGHIVSAQQPVGRPDVAGMGHRRHSRFWADLANRNAIIAV